MSKPTDKTTKTVRLTARERYLINHALRIAIEDGSIYGGEDDDKKLAKINAEIEAIERKL